MLGTNQLQTFIFRGTNDVRASFAGTNRFVIFSDGADSDFNDEDAAG